MHLVDVLQAKSSNECATASSKESFDRTPKILLSEEFFFKKSRVA